MRFALIGAAGYIAKRHMKAIQETGNDLVAALDPHDSVGILDSFFPEAEFFTEYERFDRFLEKLHREGNGVDYLVVCSPNYLHDAHCGLGMRLGANIICEKPVVINPWNLDALQVLEQETQRRINVVLQLRLHPAIQEMHKKFSTGYHNVALTYTTPRGKWYHSSWKADEAKSGGLAMNIGVHLFDMLLWTFGKPLSSTVIHENQYALDGVLRLERAFVHWKLSTQGEKNRIMQVDGEPINFTNGFEDLHTEVYRHVLSGQGFTLDDARPAIELVYHLRRIPCGNTEAPKSTLAHE